MTHYIHNRFCTIIIVCISLICGICSQAQPRLGVVYPFSGANQILVRWNKVAGAEEYEYRRKVDGGAYSAWTSKALDTAFYDSGLAAASTYSYQVRVKVAGVWSGESNEKKNSLQRVWPVKKAADCTTEVVELLHGFGQPIEAGGKKYFHEGIDINGEKTVENECVKAPVGAIVVYHGGSGSNIAVNLQVYINGGTQYIQFNHLKNLNANLVDGETVAPGDSLGFIANGIWNTLTSHTHCHYWSTYANLFGTAQNPFNIWDNDAYRDPQGNSPELMDTNGDGEFLRFRKTPSSTDYFADNKVHNGVDIVAEVIDKQTTSAPWQTPKVVGYYIQRQDNGAWIDAVKSAAAPYVLVDHNIYYQSNSTTSNLPVVTTIIDYRNALKATTPAGYDFNQWFTYIVTNTKGTGGAIADLDSAQQWSTDARKSVAEANGYVTNYNKARAIDEAKFPDGKYKTFIRMADFVRTSPDKEKEIKVDNFRPYAKKVEIKSGKLNYLAIWNWNEGSGELVLADNTSTEKACGKINITITMSEPMTSVNLEIPTLTYAKINTTPKAATDGKVWEFEIPEDKTKDAEEGPHKLLINGKDIADNELQGFLSKTNVPAIAMEKKLLDGTFTPGNPPAKDKVHEFKLFSLKDKISVSTTDASGCDKPDGKATITVSVTGDFEYAVDGGAFQASNKFENLAKGNHVAKVKDKKADCEAKKDFSIKAGPPLSVSVSGYGTTQFCNNANPPTITLIASASGGSGKFVYSWPGATLKVSSSGTYTVTVTDTVTNCKESVSGQVIFVPIICSRDPNDIVGPDGYSKRKMVSKFQPQPYLIHFENDPHFATAPAQVVKINHPLDSTVNILSVRLGDFGFSKFTFPVPANKTYYSARLNVKDSLGIVVDVTAGIDVDKKEVFWIFESKDPATGLPPANSKLGFLPVNDSTAVGEGYVSYTVKPANNTVTGDTIHAEASIVFDINAPLATPKIFNTIDAVAPLSAMKPLGATTDSTIVLKWSGHDEVKGSGVRDYTVYVSEDGGTFSAYQSGITDTSITFKRGSAYSYSFFTRASDNTGNQEALKNKGEVTIVSPGNEYYRSIITGSWNNISTWESSVDSITWKAASVIPTNASKNITIRGMDTVTVNADITTDQTVVEPGGVLAAAAGKTLTVLNNGLTLRSAADKTASIGQSEGKISGNVVVERFIPARAAWRLLTAPFSSSQTIKAAWQEDGVFKPGFGTQITGGALTDGFDQGASNFPSIKRYNQTNTAFNSLTSTLIPLTDQPGYMVFVRGDRSIDLSQGAPAVANNTILRATGQLKTGTQPAVAVPPAGFTLIGNPYASSIDFTKITKTNVPERFYVWDPKRANSGAFVLFDGADGYEPMTKSGSYTGANTFIESAQAFFVAGSNDTGLIVIAENSKSGVQRNAFRSSVDDGKLQVNLKGLRSDSTVVQLDEALTRYSNDYSAAVNGEDAGKLNNLDENLSVLRGGKQLTVERRPVITTVDTIFLKIENIGVKKYQFEIAPANLDATVAAAYLEDLWLKTSTILSLTNSTVVPFSITTDVASADPSRFRIVLKTGRALPLQITSVKAYQKDAGIRVDWNVESETNTSYYEVEKSANGQEFLKVGKVMATGSNGLTSSYNWLDLTPFDGNNFYRIKTVDRFGNVKVSEVVVVRISTEKKSIVIYPNPVIGKTIIVQLNNQPKGEYLLQLFNSLGQQLLNRTIIHLGGSATQTIPFGSVISKGVYQLFITNGEDKITQQLIVQ